ncbi:MAG: substrate-binding domain-containing protein [Mycoplasmataceae bacterium]|nr:substrate-binding domain-containing protein [Mycoplasmataceae bacterium]
MKRWIKNTRTVALCLIPIGLVTAFSNSWSNKIPISCVGSSGVKPFVESLSKEYMKANKKVDITVEAGGSGFGIQQISQGFANIGNASKDPYSAVYGKDDKGTDGFRSQWEKNKIKTITIGWEAICMVYIPPKELNLNPDELNNILVVNNSNVCNLMRIFSGINSNVTDATLGNFYNDQADLTPSQQQLLMNTSIIPYVRAGGSLTSGTASSFVGGTHLNFNEKNDLTVAQQNAFDSGYYGTKFGLVQTDEANSRAWDIFAKNNKPGQIVYLSSGFVKQNLDLIKSKGYGIMAYDGSETQTNPTSFDVNFIDSHDGYNWFRPLNLMIPVTNNESFTTEMNFIKTLLSDEYKNKLIEIGAKYLNTEEIEQIFPNDISGIWKSDYQLAKEKEADWNWPKDYNFAPIPSGISDN